jgi:hypothetical protein
LEAEDLRCPPEVDFEDLPDVHAGGHAQRVKQDIDRRAVFEERHIFDRDDTGDDTLVTVPTSHLVTDGQWPFGGEIDLDHFEHARAELVAALHVSQATLLLFFDRFDTWPELVVELGGLLLDVFGTLDPLRVERLDLLDDDLGDV